MKARSKAPFLLAALVAWGPVRAAEPAAEEPDPWQQAAELNYAAAHAAFARQAADGSPVARLGEALTLLNLAPKTRDRIVRAEALFTALSLPDIDVEVRVAARYFLGRMAQVHRYEPDWVLAANHFKGLWQDHPHHTLAQLGVVKLALVWLYEVVDPAVRRERFVELEAIASALTYVPAQRDLHYVMGVAYLNFEGDPRDALRHFLACEAVGARQGRTLSYLYLRIAELALRTDQPELARRYYTHFTTSFPTDFRVNFARARLALLASQTATKPLSDVD